MPQTLSDHLLTDEQRMLRETVTRFARAEIAPWATEWEEQGEYPRELHQKAAKLDLLGVGIAEEHGGAGGGAMETLMCIEGLMQGGSTGVTVGLGTHQIALPPIWLLGSPEQIARWVPPVLRGEHIAALAITEPGAGSDVAGLRTRAVRDGDHYIVNGSKLYISGGVRADVLTTLVRTSDDPHGGLTFLVIEKGTPGLSVSRALQKTGWWASDTAELAFDDVRVPVANRLGEEGHGFLALMRNFQMERLALAGYGYVTAEIALDESMKWIREREAFGRRIADFQVTRHRIAKMATRVEAAKTLVRNVANRIDAGEYRVLEVSMAKNFAAQVAVDVCYDAVQLHGGMGYMRETLVERLSRDARLLPIGGGTEEVMNEIISRELGLNKS